MSGGGNSSKQMGPMQQRQSAFNQQQQQLGPMQNMGVGMSPSGGFQGQQQNQAQMASQAMNQLGPMQGGQMGGGMAPSPARFGADGMQLPGTGFTAPGARPYMPTIQPPGMSAQEGPGMQMGGLLGNAMSNPAALGGMQAGGMGSLNDAVAQAQAQAAQQRGAMQSRPANPLINTGPRRGGIQDQRLAQVQALRARRGY